MTGSFHYCPVDIGNHVFKARDVTRATRDGASGVIRAAMTD